MFPKRKRKQCKQCFKTFYKPVEGWIEHPLYDGYKLTWSECPYCGGSWIVV